MYSMNIHALKEYIDINYDGDIKVELMKYINSNFLQEDVDHILKNDDTITESFAAQCALEQYIESITNV